MDASAVTCCCVHIPLSFSSTRFIRSARLARRQLLLLDTFRWRSLTRCRSTRSATPRSKPPLPMLLREGARQRVPAT
ncbi:hypothetical protein VFPFJ_06384 [Purpureocillium lilacinum]|uniref:Uncharacterized protein n=1 Tax=Purpureocillium lilacinum TaxID=33203 RepID=A0A179HKH6_PURLI|nr:hypothetical protein VFPFJ_06384 [Purpureocillium lilacinum]OAQ89970.1 hypothetical protein VFPFJ_06384 [Purpureocillium lilacinum]